MLEKISTCHNNHKKSSTTKLNKHTPSGYSLFTHCSFDTTKNKFDYYGSKHCTKNFCLDLREYAIKIISYEKRRNDTLNKKRRENYNKQKVCYICKKKLSTDDGKKTNFKVTDHCNYIGKYRGTAHDICNLRYKIPK